MALVALLPGTQAPGEASGRIGLALVAVALVVLFSLLNPSFFRLENFVVIGVNSTSILIAVLGTSALLIAGYVDLSIGSMVALIGIIVAKVAVATQDALLAIGVGLGLGFLLGLVNGILVRKLEHLAADRDAGDAGALWRPRLRGQQHGGLRFPRGIARAGTRQDRSASSTP